MGNIGGVRKDGLTLTAVETAMREVLDECFPGVFRVIGPESALGAESVAVQVIDRRPEDDLYLLVWFDEGAGEDPVYPGLIGGKHPRIGQFGYWLLSVIEFGIAKKLGTRLGPVVADSYTHTMTFRGWSWDANDGCYIPREESP